MNINLTSFLIGYRGSIAHNMYVPNSDPNSIDDKDLMNIVIPGQEYYYGLKEFGSRGTQEIKKGELDIVVYEFKKFISLLAKGNPNVLSMLWLRPEHYLYLSDEAKILLENRSLFVGKHVYHSFIGYAKSQFYKMNHLAFKGYMGDKRKKLVEKFGYDTKNAAHLIRLMRMAIEFLREGQLEVFRTKDVLDLLAIKKGSLTLNQVKKEALALFTIAEIAYNKSSLPLQVDYDKINNLSVEILNKWFNKT